MRGHLQHQRSRVPTAEPHLDIPAHRNDANPGEIRPRRPGVCRRETATRSSLDVRRPIHHAFAFLTPDLEAQLTNVIADSRWARVRGRRSEAGAIRSLGCNTGA